MIRDSKTNPSKKKGPQQVHISITPNIDELYVGWITADKVNGVVRYGTQKSVYEFESTECNRT